MEIDKEAAELIIESYRRINHLQGILKESSFAQLKELAQNGNALNGMMNDAMQELSGYLFGKHLTGIISCVKNMLENSENFMALPEGSTIAFLLDDLLVSLTSLQSKIGWEE